MASIKYTDEGQRQRLERLKSLRETRNDIAELVGLKNSPEWIKLIRLFRRWEEFAKREERQVNAEHDLGELNAETFSKLVTRARQKVADFGFVADILDKREEKLKLLDEEIAKVESAFKEAKEVLA